jgi:hypothetical protein
MILNNKEKLKKKMTIEQIREK